MLLDFMAPLKPLIISEIIFVCIIVYLYTCGLVMLYVSGASSLAETFPLSIPRFF